MISSALFKKLTRVLKSQTFWLILLCLVKKVDFFSKIQKNFHLIKINCGKKSHIANENQDITDYRPKLGERGISTKSVLGA